MSVLFSPIRLAELELANRVVVSPMCQYSAVDGVPQPWHARHLGSLAISGAALVFVEATGVEAEGRISPGCTGLWSDDQEAAWGHLIADIRTYSTTPIGIQLAHAGRKASMGVPWVHGARALTPDEGGWNTKAPSAICFGEGFTTPQAMDEAGMTVVRDAFANAARRAHRAGFDVVELHAAHGYLMHEFCSPLANKRTDRYGGSLDNRLRFPLEVAAAMREAWPRERPLGARITGSDWIDGGFTPDEAGVFATRLRETGFDYVDVSSGAIAPGIPIPGGELAYQLPFAETVKAASGLPTMTVGMIVDPHQAEAIVASGKADMVSLARAFLDDPNWAHHARAALGDPPAPPVQYARAWPEAWPGWKIAHPATP